MPRIPFDRNRLRALQRIATMVFCALLLCGSFLAVPYIAAAIPPELSDHLSDRPHPDVLQALQATSKPPTEVAEPSEDSFEAQESVDFVDEPSVPPVPQVPPDGALTVLAENFCWYDDPADAALHIINDTSYRVNLSAYSQRTYPITAAIGDEPLVLIVHTHGTESYLPDGVDYYLPNEDFRSEDPSQTVVAVGETIAETLRSMGIPVLHDTTMHDRDDFNNAYTESRAAIRSALAEHPSIRYVLDVHRDSIFDRNDRCEKTLTTIDGKNMAQIMLVVGTDEGGAAHSGWQTNLTVATHLQEQLNRLSPTLARPINLRTAAFNQALTTGSLLLEVGSCGNTIREACDAGRLFAVSFAALLLSNCPS